MKKGLIYALLVTASLSFAAVSMAEEKTPASSSAPPADAAEASLQDVQKEVQNVMNEMLSITGEIVSGMSAGMQEGADTIQAQLDGADGTRLIANKKDLAELLQVSVSKCEGQGDNAWRITLAIKNANDFPVRLVNLNRRQSVLLLDTEGFAHNPVTGKDSARTLTVPSRAAVKAAFEFSGLEAKPGVIRLFDTDFQVQ